MKSAINVLLGLACVILFVVAFGEALYLGIIDKRQDSDLMNIMNQIETINMRIEKLTASIPSPTPSLEAATSTAGETSAE
jgi:hypothetical protein